MCFWETEMWAKVTDQILCKYWAGTVLMSTSSNPMSNILIIVTHISSPPSVTTKTLPLPGEGWRVLLLLGSDTTFPIMRILARKSKYTIQRGLSNSVGGTKDWNLNRCRTDRLRKGAALCNLLNFLRKSSIASQPNVSVCPLGSCLYSSLWKKQDVSI